MSESVAFEVFDGRVKLLPCQKERMAWMRETYDLSYRALAAQYSISASEAYYVCNPESTRKKNIKNAKNSHRYKNKEKDSPARARRRKKIKDLNSIFHTQKTML